MMACKGFFAGTVCAVLALTGAWTSFASEATRTPKALVIMLDGCRADVFGSWATPTFRQLRDGQWQAGYRCAWSLNATTIYDASPSSAPNHVSIATGVTAAKHGCTGNDLATTTAAHWDTYPCWLKRVVTADPTRKALFVYKWSADAGFGGGTDGVPQYNSGTEAGNLAKVLEELNASNGADAILYYIDAPDATGHSTGFYSLNDTYYATVQTCDNYIAQCLAAIAARPTFKDEDWYIAVTADHGGVNKTHGVFGGHCESIPVCIASPNVPHGRIAGTPYHMITTVTALEHFGIDTSSLSLDQVPLTAAMVADPAGQALADGLQYYVNFDDASTIANALDNGKTVSTPQGMGTSTLGADGKFGKCFTATNRGVQLDGTKNHDFVNGTDFCLTMWVKVASGLSSDPCIFGDKNWNAGTNNGFAFVANRQWGSTEKVGFAFNCKQSGGRSDTSTIEYEVGQWEFYAVVREGSTGFIGIYRGRRDGTLEWLGRNIGASFIWGGYDFHVGQDGTGTYGVSLNGTGIDDVGFWGRALNVEEIRRVFTAGQQGRSLGDLLAADAEPATLAVSSFSNDSVELVIGGDSPRAHKLFVASGASDGGDNKQSWIDFTEVADIPAGTKSYTFTPPAAWSASDSATSYRFFLLQTTDLPYAQELEYVKSDGNAYVVTDFAPYNPYVRVATDLLAPVQNGAWMWMLGSYSTANKTVKTGNFSLARRDNNKFYWEITGGNSDGRAFDLNTKYAVSFSPTTLTVDGVDYATGQTRTGFQTGTYKLTLYRTCKNGAYGTSYDSTYNGRFYNFRCYDHERPVQDLVPVKTSDDKVGFYDTVYGKFYGNSGSGSLTAGTLDETKEAARRGIVRAQSVTLSFQPATVPVLAVWTGAGADPTAYTAADNWSCTNALGVHLPNAVPTADTEQIVLDADADWRALTAGTEIAAPVDLRGHALTLAAAVTGTVRDSSETTGTVRFDVAAGATLANTNLKLENNLKLVKAGAGTLVQQVMANTYTGGTEVQGGTLTTPVSGSSSNTWAPSKGLLFGQYNTAITVRSGAIFDYAGNYDYDKYAIVLDGGTLRNSGCDQTKTTWSSVTRVSLTADSTLDYGCTSLMSSGSMIDLGGHTLDVHIADGRYWFVCAGTFTNGTVKVSLDGTQATGGRIQLLGNVESSTASWDCNCCLEFKSNITLRDFTCRRDGLWGWSDVSKKVFVKGTFWPVSDYFCNVEMQNGSTLDLTMKSAVWSSTSRDTANGSIYKTTFANDAAVTVKLTGRTLAVADQVIAWTEQPTSTTFVWDAATAEAGVASVSAAVGLYYGTDPESRVVETAVWNGGAGNGDLTDFRNWTCRNLAGNVVTEAVPGEVAKVTIAGENLNVQIPVGSPVYAKVTIGECTLGTNCDWRGLNQDIDGTVYLNGYQLQLSHARGTGRVFNNLLVNGGFEQFSPSVNSCSYLNKGITLAGWTPKTEGLGVSAVNTTWITGNGDKPMPQGSWALFVQADARLIEQTFTVKEAGAYTLIFYAAGRPNHLGLAINAQIDGTTVATAPCDSIAWTRYTVPLTLTTGEHKVGFLSATTSDGDVDVGAAIDAVILSRNGASEVVVDVPEGKVEENNPRLELDGNFSLVKEGAGTLTMTYGPQSYMGTEIHAGTLRCGATIFNQFGICRDCEVGVAPGAVFDLWGRHATRYIIRLDGGELRNSHEGASVGDWEVYVPWVRLTADSTFTYDTMKENHDVHVDSFGVWDMGGHTFTITLRGTDPDLYAHAGATFTNGTLRLTDDRKQDAFFVNRGLNGTADFTLDQEVDLRLDGNSTVGNFINRAWSSSVRSSDNCLLTVTGTYAPLSKYSLNTLMANGSTVDLSTYAEPWNTTTTNTVKTLTCTTTFADNATVTIDLGTRKVKHGDKIVTWTKPSNLDTLTFKLPKGVNGKFEKCDDGLYLSRMGLVFVIK